MPLRIFGLLTHAGCFLKFYNFNTLWGHFWKNGLISNRFSLPSENGLGEDIRFYENCSEWVLSRNPCGKKFNSLIGFPSHGILVSLPCLILSHAHLYFSADNSKETDFLLGGKSTEGRVGHEGFDTSVAKDLIMSSNGKIRSMISNENKYSFDSPNQSAHS